MLFRSKMEDQDWLGKRNTETIQALIATLRARSSPTVIGKLDDRGTITDLKERAEAGLSHQRNDEEPALTTPEAFQVTGVKLSNATQSLLYQGIIRRRKDEQRAASSYNLGITQACVEELTGKCPTQETIWRSMRNKAFPPRIQSFLWKIMYNAYKCGKHWRNIPTCEERPLPSVRQGGGVDGAYIN